MTTRWKFLYMRRKSLNGTQVPRQKLCAKANISGHLERSLENGSSQEYAKLVLEIYNDEVFRIFILFDLNDKTSKPI